eukprot:TRINITY_DN10728_c0_g3_i1.p1 TRINITY_DN10728_c0_g3~~TRINITY_DN10728_c0_g3_i1.p1  ORF type:complete len:790 (+),score=192.10 TRINITY_DN10728_c0_g3_i1:81-2372(+)
MPAHGGRRRYQPITLPRSAAGLQNNISHSIYSYRWIKKISTKGVPQMRALVTTSLFLIQLKDQGVVTRMVPLDEIAALEWDRGGTKAALRPISSSKERDWIFEWADSPENTHPDPEEWIEVVNQCRDLIVPEGAPPLRWLPFDASRKYNTERQGNRSVQERLRLYEQHPELVPRRKKPLGWSRGLALHDAAAAAATPVQTHPQVRSPVTPAQAYADWDAGVRTFQVSLQHEEEPLGIDYLHRVPIDASSAFAAAESGVFITRVKPGGACDRAGVTTGRIVAIDGHRIDNVQDLHDVVGMLYGDRVQDFNMEVAVDEEVPELEDTALSQTMCYTLGGEGVPALYTVQLTNAQEPLGLSYMCETLPGDPAGKVRITGIDPGGACERAGMPPGRLLTIDGKPIGTVEELSQAVAAARSRAKPVLEFVLLVHPANLHNRAHHTRAATATPAPLPPPSTGPSDEYSSPELMATLAGARHPDEALVRQLNELMQRRRRGQLSETQYAIQKRNTLDALRGGDDLGGTARSMPRQLPAASPPPGGGAPPPSPWARVRINRYIFLRERPFRGSWWVPGGGVHGTLQVLHLDGDFALVRTEDQRQGYMRTRYLQWLSAPPAAGSQQSPPLPRGALRQPGGPPRGALRRADPDPRGAPPEPSPWLRDSAELRREIEELMEDDPQPRPRPYSRGSSWGGRRSPSPGPEGDWDGHGGRAPYSWEDAVAPASSSGFAAAGPGRYPHLSAWASQRDGGLQPLPHFETPGTWSYGQALP